MEQSLQELHDLKSYLGTKLSQHLAAGGRSDDPFVRSVWDLHGELEAALEEFRCRLDEGIEPQADGDHESADESDDPMEELTNFGYLRWLLEHEEVEGS
jgi:hypothetical protein